MSGASQPGEVLWGFFYSDCSWENPGELVSLHRSKREAYRAMIAHQYSAWDRWQRDRWHEPSNMNSWYVRGVEVLP